jgi:hypothetical protein
LAEVAHGKPDELVAARFEPHPFELLVRAALVRVARTDAPLEALELGGQRVARALERAQVEQPRKAAGNARTRGRGDIRRARRRDVREALGHDRRELTLEARDLLPQRAARRSLRVVALGRERRRRTVARSRAGSRRLRGGRFDEMVLTLPQGRCLLAGGNDGFYQRRRPRFAACGGRRHGCASAARADHNASST